MVIGDIKKIDLSTSSFELMIVGECLYVDKTQFIEHFLNEGSRVQLLNEDSRVQLVTRQRRLGKSINMDMLRCFLTDKTDYRLRSVKYDCFWGKSGTMDMITRLFNDERKLTMTKLLNGERTAPTAVDDRISLKQLAGGATDKVFYSLLVQAGYLVLDEQLPDRGGAILTIPNKELLIVWKEFILENLYSDSIYVKTLFDNTNSPEKFARDLEYFLSDRLSYHDLSAYKENNKEKTHERIYHIFMLGILSAYEDVRCKFPLSNRESGDGRYDIFVERPDCNYIFEFKSCKPRENISAKASDALAQIDIKRYDADIESDKRLIKTGIAFRGKQCRVKASSK